jgi:membrane protein implicated in regulation of membrane protease activity
MMQIYGPILAYAFLVVPIFAVIAVGLMRPSGRPALITLFLVIYVAVALLAVGLMTRVKGTLEMGLAGNAEVVDAMGPRGRFRVRVNGRDIVTSDNSGSPRLLAVGDRVSVLMDAGQGKILLMLDTVTT